MSDVGRSWQKGPASIVVGLGHAVAPLNHLGPHSDVETVLYLGLTVLLLVVVARMIRGSNDTVPRVTKPRRTKVRSDQTSGSEDWTDDPDADLDPDA